MAIFNFYLSFTNYLKWANFTSILEEYEEFLEFLFLVAVFLVFYQYYLESFYSEIQNYNRKLIQEQKKMETILRDLSDAVIVIDIHEKIEFINKKADEILQIKSKESIQKKIDEILIIMCDKDNQVRRVYPKDTYYSKIENNQFISRHNRDYFIHIPNFPDKPKIQIQFYGTTINNEKNIPIGGLIVIQDITKQKRIEKMLIETERIQSITLLARGLAHDFNNILTAIIGNLGLLKESNKLDEVSQEFIEEIEHSTLRAKNITGQLATLARNKRDVEKKNINVSNLVKKSIDFSLRGTNIIPVYNFELTCYTEGNEDDLSRVFYNLAINAMHSMPNGGSIEVKISYPTLPAISQLIDENIKYVQISVEDHGEGIQKEKMKVIFQPFYTTKAQGTGLGLTIVENIIKNHDGFIFVDSKIGKGTIFTILLPQNEKFEKSAITTLETKVRFDGKILVLEDDETVSYVLKKMLNSLGFKVDLTIKGKDTIQHYQKAMKNNTKYYAVILDIVLQGDEMNGVEVLQEIKKMDSNAFTVLSSGSIEYSTFDETLKLEKIHFLNKPYLISDLREILSKKDNVDL